MSRKIDLPDGGWAEIRDPADLTERQRRIIRRSFPAGARLIEKLKLIREAAKATNGNGTASVDDADQAGGDIYQHLDPDELEGLNDMKCASIVAYVSTWSLGLALPLTMDTVQDLPGPIWDALAAETFGKGDGAEKLDDESPGALLDRNSPPVPSSPSDGEERAPASQQSEAETPATSSASS